MKRIAEFRKKIGLTQKEFGKLIGSAQNTVCNWENGKREPYNETLNKLADFFGVTVGYLTENEPEETIKRNDEENNVVVLDDEALELMDHLRTRPEMKTLFSVSKNATAEDILKTIKIIEALKEEK